MVDGAVLAYGVTFLVTPGRQYLERTQAIPVEVVTPPGWTAVSTWPLADTFTSSVVDGSTVYAYVAADATQLREAFLVTGPAVQTTRRSDGEELVEVAFGSAFGGDRDHFADFVSAVTKQYASRYGAPGPVHVYVSSGATTNQELTGIGRRNGFVVNVPADDPLSESARLLVAHEALHLWNGHRLVPRPDAEIATRWFKEGVTHYLALKMLARTDTASENFVLGELARSAASYARNPLSRGATGSELDRARFPYDFGFLVAHAADAALHAQSGGRVSGEDWLAAMLARGDEPYDEQDLLVALQSLAGGQEGVSAAERVWRRYVRVREPFDLAELFAQVGLHWLPETDESAGRLVPLARQLGRRPASNGCHEYPERQNPPPDLARRADREGDGPRYLPRRGLEPFRRQNHRSHRRTDPSFRQWRLRPGCRS